MTAGIGIDKASELTPKDFDRLLLRTLTAVKKGDFRVRMPVEFTGTSGKIADTLNEIIELNERLSSEIERISTVVGKEGKLSARAQIPNGGGAWSNVADAGNSLIADLVQPTNEISRANGAVAKGDPPRPTGVEVARPPPQRALL